MNIWLMFLMRRLVRLLLFIDKTMNVSYIINEGGVSHFYKNGKLHREDGPAIEYADGYKAWYLNGNLHRTDGPAVEYATGTKFWYLNGVLHRTDGPAIEYNNGDKLWYINGKLHREGAPAVEHADGGTLWYLNSNLHREDGPAWVIPVGQPGAGVRYFIDGWELTKDNFEKRQRAIKCFDDKVVDIDGVKYMLKRVD